MPILLLVLIVPALLVEIASIYSDIAMDPAAAWRLDLERLLGFDVARFDGLHQAFPGQIGSMVLTFSLVHAGMTDLLFGGFCLMLFSAMVIDTIGTFRLMLAVLASSIGAALGHVFLAGESSILTGLAPIAFGVLAMKCVVLAHECLEQGDRPLFPLLFALPFAGLHILPGAAFELPAIGPVLGRLQEMTHLGADSGAAMAGGLMGLFFILRDRFAGSQPSARATDHRGPDRL